MAHRTNEFGQPIGLPVEGWTPPPPPGAAVLDGRYCRLERLSLAHAADLHAANEEAGDGRYFTYLSAGPFATLDDYRAWITSTCLGDDPFFYTIIDRDTGQPGGIASYLRITPGAGTIEVGHINFAPRLQRRRAATEAMFLMMRHAFELGYRRYEWKCDALNAASRRAAERLGFTYEGTFRQALVSKGRNRDTAWYSIVDSEWPRVQRDFERWLDPANFDAAGRQRHPLR